MPAIVTSAVVAEALNLTERRVEQLAHEGMPRISRGKYDLWSCAQWYIRYLQKAIERRATDTDTGDKTNLNEEKKRLTRMQANIAEVEYKQKIGELIPAQLVDDKFVTFAGTVRDRFLALPSRVAKRLEGESRDDIQRILYEAFRDLLNTLAGDLAGAKGAGSRRGAGKRASRKVPKARGEKTRRRS